MLFFFLACEAQAPDSGGTGEVYDRSPDILALVGDTAAGADIFSGFCSSCHGYSGEGDIGPALSDTVPSATREHLVDVVLNGWDSSAQSSRMSGMPSLTDQDIANVVDYAQLTWSTGEEL